MLEEILEIKEKLETLIIDFDEKIRKNFIVEAKYNVPLKEEITPLLILEGQINMHKAALKAAEEGKSVQEITGIVETMKKQLVNSTYNQQRKLISFTNIMSNLEKYSEADFESFKTSYKEMVLKHHPALTLIQNQEERNKFGLLRELFLQSDIEQFEKAKKELTFGTYEDNGLTDEEALKEIKIAYDEFSREFERISKFDDNFRALQAEVEDEMLLARNQANLRQRLYKAKQEIVEVYGQTQEEFEGSIDFDLVKTE